MYYEKFRDIQNHRIAECLMNDLAEDFSRPVDVQIAALVMEEKWDGKYWVSRDGNASVNIDGGPSLYSSRMADAWRVVEELNPSRFNLTWDGKSWLCEFGNESAVSDTAPMAICQAALATLEKCTIPD